MKSRCQGRAFTASGDITTAKVSDSGNTGKLCYAIRIADLQGEGGASRLCRRRSMADSLAVTADGAHILFCDACLFEQC